MEAAYVVIVSNHWVAVRGNWFCDSFTYGVPVKIKDAPHRRKRVRFVYVVSVAPIRTQPRADRLTKKRRAAVESARPKGRALTSTVTGRAAHRMQLHRLAIGGCGDACPQSVCMSQEKRSRG